MTRHLWVLGVAAVVAFGVARPAAPGPPPALRNLAAIQINAIVDTATAGAIVVARPAQSAIVRPGETLASLALEYGGTVGAIRWANLLGPGAAAPIGSTLLIPPSAGALVKVRSGETPTSFAARLGLDPAVVLDYNALMSNAPLPAGRYLQVPLAHAPLGSLISAYFDVASGGVPEVPAQRVPADGFPYGQCTYYVATRRIVNWAGNAVAWWWAASGKRPEGHVPVQGAIVVFDIGWTGHVAYIEHVNEDGSFVVSEMNYYGGGGGWGRVDHRTIEATDASILGFIY